MFAWLTALLTAYLCTAFLLGLTARLACLVGGAASILFLLTQFLTTFTLSGGTDVGPHPLYLLICLILLLGGAGKYLSVDRWIRTRGPARVRRVARWLCGPSA